MENKLNNAKKEQPKEVLILNIKKHINTLVATNGIEQLRCYNCKQIGYYSSNCSGR